MKLVLQIISLVCAVAGGVNGHDLRGPAMMVLSDESEEASYPPNSTPAQRLCTDGCRDRFTKHHKKRSCERKCLELDDEDAMYIANFLRYEDVDFVAEFIDQGPGIAGFPVECDPDVIFGGYPSTRRGYYHRAASNKQLKELYPQVWSDTKEARNRCKKAATPQLCRQMGYCF